MRAHAHARVFAHPPTRIHNADLRMFANNRSKFAQDASKFQHQASSASATSNAAEGEQNDARAAASLAHADYVLRADIDEFSARRAHERLGVDRDASVEVVKRAYLRLSKRVHPDKNAGDDATARFQLVKEAYDILSDPLKKLSHYADGSAARFPSNPYAAQQGAAFAASFFNAFGAAQSQAAADFVNRTESAFFAAADRKRKRKRERKAPDTIINLELTLEEMALGCESRVTYNRRVVTASSKREPPAMDHALHVPGGVHDGHEMIFDGKGDQYANMKPGHLIVRLRQKPHAYFLRDKKGNVCYKQRVRLADLILGCELAVRTLDAKPLRIVFSAPILLHRHRIVKNEGAYKCHKGPLAKQRGDLCIEMLLEMPAQTVSREFAAEEALLREILESVYDKDQDPSVMRRTSSSSSSSRAAGEHKNHETTNNNGAVVVDDDSDDEDYVAGRHSIDDDDDEGVGAAARA